MTVKNCYILDNSRGFVFYGPIENNLDCGTKTFKGLS